FCLRVSCNFLRGFIAQSSCSHLRLGCTLSADHFHITRVRRQPITVRCSRSQEALEKEQCIAESGAGFLRQRQKLTHVQECVKFLTTNLQKIRIRNGDRKIAYKIECNTVRIRVGRGSQRDEVPAASRDETRSTRRRKPLMLPTRQVRVKIFEISNYGSH